jgi:hypothetical protein
MAYQPNPAQVIGCCGGNKHRFVPNYAMNMWMGTKDKGIAATLYGPSTVSAKVGATEQEVQITQRTNYPFEEEIQFEVKTHGPVTFPFALRIPGWCASPTIKVNGSVVTARTEKGFATLRRTFRSGDVVTLNLPMTVKMSEWPENGIGLERGPLVYAMPIETKWTSVVEASYSSEAFPTWEANPVGPWNYGLAIDPSKIATDVVVNKKASSPNLAASAWPWTDAPVTLSVPARKIDGWDFETNPKAPHQRFTPHLPAADKINASGPVEQITLVPFGATQLRMSIFPKVKT